jgi:alpha-galactosidase
VKACNLFGCHTVGEPVNGSDNTQVLFCCKIQLEVNKVSPEGSLGAHIGELGNNPQRQVAVLTEQTENTDRAFRLFFFPSYFGQFGESKQYSYCRNQCCQRQIRALY